MSSMEPVILLKYIDDFFVHAASTLNWDDLDDKVVMDIGCGRGYSSTTFTKRFPAIKRLIAIDKSLGRLNEAREINSHPKVEYAPANIANKNTIDSWIGGIDVAISIFCFQCVTHQRKGYKNLFSLLRPTGHAVILQGLTSSFFDIYENLVKLPNWSIYTDQFQLSIPESHKQKYTDVHYRKLFEEIGFQVVECKHETQNYAYASDEVCKDALFKYCPINAIIPEGRKLEFMSDLFKMFLKHNKRTDDGRLYMTHGTLSAILRKPEDSKAHGKSKE